MGLAPVDGSAELLPRNVSAKGAQELMRELSELNTRIENVTTRWEVATGQDRRVLGSMLIHPNGSADQVRQDLQFFRGELPSYKHVPLVGSTANLLNRVRSCSVPSVISQYARPFSENALYTLRGNAAAMRQLEL
ncbi:hypothetical protein I4F81_001552 [Pyropia yezoensis]|uniref:Uncharacterized protein n=1 Tax=Pyropia yezoensis TaxID=2788 RepID=A0ACC3BM13_PYRYE|nr:hypothetical protein I4F81_001552 [Neopyropia yezoensis]